MANNWFSGVLPVTRDDATIAQEILAHVAAMRKDGSFEGGTSLCWDPAQLEKLAMFAIGAKADKVRLDWLEERFAALKPGRHMSLWRDRSRPNETARSAIDSAKDRGTLSVLRSPNDSQKEEG